MLISLPLYVFPLCMLAAAISDMRKFIIPNTVSIVLIGAFIASFAISGLGWDVLQNHLIAGFGMLIIGMILWFDDYPTEYSVGGYLGGGDVKLLAAAAFWLGWPVFGHALIYITLCGGLLAIGFLAARLFARLFPRLSLTFKPLAKLAAEEKPPLPYGVAIAVGAVYVFPQSALFQAIVGS